jgi:capsular polysaccharide biosynthesis protein
VIASKVPQGAGEAAAIAGQASAFATSPDVLSAALRSTGLDRDLNELAKSVTMTGLGSSPLATLSVTDRDRNGARLLTSALAVQVTGQIDQSRVSGLRTVLSDVTKRIADLTSQLAKAQKAVLANPKSAERLQKRDDLQRALTDQKALRSNVVDQTALTGQSRVVSWATPPAEADSQRLLQMVVVALAGGIVLGVVLASAVETVRPTIPGVRRVSRRLGVPLLGCVRGRNAAVLPLVRRLRLAARRAEVRTVVLVGTDGMVARGVVEAIAAALPHAPEALETPVKGEQIDESLVSTVEGDLPAKKNASGGLSTALAAKRVVMQAETAPIPVVTIPAKPEPGFRLVRLEDVPMDRDLENVGLVLVSRRVTRLANLYVINDLVEASGWPLLGVIADYAPRRLVGRGR